MKVDLSIHSADPISLNNKLQLIQAFMAKGLRVCLGDIDRDGNVLKETKSPAVANQTFVITHTLGVVPDFLFTYSHGAAGSQTCNVTDSERKLWDTRTIAVHSAATSMVFTALVASLK